MCESTNGKPDDDATVISAMLLYASVGVTRDKDFPRSVRIQGYPVYRARGDSHTVREGARKEETHNRTCGPADINIDSSAAVI